MKWLVPLSQPDQQQDICPAPGTCFPIQKRSQLSLNYNPTFAPTEALEGFLWRHLLKELKSLDGDQASS